MLFGVLSGAFRRGFAHIVGNVAFSIGYLSPLWAGS